MSDFLLTSQKQPPRKLKSLISNIHSCDLKNCFEFHGDWGSLAVFENHYYSWNPYEDERYICVIIGGPVLKFTKMYKNPKFPSANAKLLLDKWTRPGGVNWHSDISGAFSAILIDKYHNTVEVITDMLSFIPIFYSTVKNSYDDIHVIGSHNDTVAALTGRIHDIDNISVADLILNGNIVYPYTFHKDVLMLQSGSKFKINEDNKLSVKNYWIPVQKENYFPNIDLAAKQLYEEVENSVKNIVSGDERTAAFLSGGEDSRAILGAASKYTNVDSFIFLDEFNREGKIAKRAAKAYNSKLTIANRNIHYYPENLEDVSKLIGSQYNFTQVHTYKFHTECNLTKYDAVLGGYCADAFFKGMLLKTKTLKLGRQILYEKLNGNSVDQKIIFDNNLIAPGLIDQVKQRYFEHDNYIKNLTINNITEWRVFLPITNKEYSANFTGNRRLFRSYEPLLDEAVIKIAAQVPVEWKLNRKLFHKAFKPYFEHSKFIPHGEMGHFPYFSTITNIPLKLLVAAKRKIFNPNKLNQGPWSSWLEVGNSKLVNSKLAKYSNHFDTLQDIFQNSTETILNDKNFNPYQKMIITRILFNIHTQYKISDKFNAEIYD